MNIKDKAELVTMYYESGTSCKEAIEKVKTSMKLYHLKLI